MQHSSLADLFFKQADRYRSKVALCVKEAGRYVDISWDEFRVAVTCVAGWLRQSGVRKGDRIAILSENRPEWVYADLGILTLGAVGVPIYATASAKEAEHILKHSGASHLFVSTRDQLARLQPVLANLPNLKRVIVFDRDVPEDDRVRSFRRLCAGTEPAGLPSDRPGVEPDDLATIIYTSGTTGPPKGVMLSHRNILMNCYDAQEALPIGEGDRSLSFLPLSHIFERMAGYYLSLLCGACIAYAENMNTVPQDMAEVRPTLACGVPRFFEKMYDHIQTTVEQSSPVQRRIFRWAIQVGRQVSQLDFEKQPIPLMVKFKRRWAVQLVFSKIANALGGELRFFVSGGAPLSKELAEFFYSAGVLILEGYGLTETSPVVSVNRLDKFRFGTVGLPLRSVQTRIAPDGEILVRGPSVMLGYYQDETATRQVLRDGWFHTGDLGSIDANGFLAITGRKKDIIVTSGGKNVSPQNIESLILRDPLVSQIVVVGDQRNYLTALIVPNWAELRRTLGVTDPSAGGSAEALAQTPAVHELVQERIEAQTQDLAAYEKIKYFTLCVREWTHEQGEMTLTLKIRRQIIGERYRDAIDQMYRVSQDPSDEGRARIFYIL